MKVVNIKALGNFIQDHAEVRSQVSEWLQEVREAQWSNPDDIKNRFPSASFLANNIVIFNLKGKKYRLAVQVTYKTKIVFVKLIGTHQQYNRWIF